MCVRVHVCMSECARVYIYIYIYIYIYVCVCVCVCMCLCVCAYVYVRACVNKKRMYVACFSVGSQNISNKRVS